MEEENRDPEIDEIVANILKAENRYYQEVTITEVDGECPYGHCAGDKFKVTAMNSDNICGSLLQTILGRIVSLHYGGGLIWEKSADSFGGSCAEGGKVKVRLNGWNRMCLNY